MTARVYLDPEEKAWIEEAEHGLVVSWPGGHVLLDDDLGMDKLFETIRLAVTDLLNARSSSAQVRRVRETAYSRGYRAGWDDAKNHKRKQAV
jgi:hypothetical protein